MIRFYFLYNIKWINCLGMANRGPNTNGCQFYITTMAAPWLNGKHTIFGKVVRGHGNVHKMEKVEYSPFFSIVDVTVARIILKSDIVGSIEVTYVSIEVTYVRLNKTFRMSKNLISATKISSFQIPRKISHFYLNSTLSCFKSQLYYNPYTFLYHFYSNQLVKKSAYVYGCHG